MTLKKIVNGQEITLSQEEEDCIKKEWLSNDLKQALVLYKSKRQSEYPPITEQLDMIYHDKINNTSNWEILISSIKNKYPKPETDI